MDKLLLSPDDVAELCSLGRTTIYEAIRSGRLASVKVGTARRVPMQAVHEFIEALGSDSSESD